MTRLLTSLTGAWVVFFATSCSDPESNPDPMGSGGSNPIGSGGNSTGSGGSSGSSGGASSAGGSSSASGGTTGAGGGGGVASGGAGTSGGAGGGGGGGGPSSGGASGSGGGGGEPGTGGSSACDLGPAPDPATRPTLVVSGPNSFWQEATPAEGSGGTTVTVTETEEQTWLGFGGTFNEAGWDALSVLPQAERDRAIALLFSPTEGANFAWGRIPMGSSDYAMERYSLNETAGDYAMENFSIERDHQMLIPYIKAAQAVKSDIKFWGSPWTPPTWMKAPQGFNGTNENPSDLGGTNDGQPVWHASMNTDEMTLQAHALYFARFVEEYESECIPIDHVQPQNEPGYTTRYPSCGWGAGELGGFVENHLAPTFENRGLPTKIWFGTLSNDTEYNGHMSGLTSAPNDRVVGVGLQWNTMGHVGQLSGQGYLVMQTEHKCGNYPWNSTTAASAEAADENSFLPGMAPNNYNYGVESWGLIRDWLEAGVHIYSAWNMVLDTLGQNLDEQRPWPQNALLVVDRDAKTLRETAAYYVFRHLSYFVDPGAVRLETMGGDALAFRNPDGNVIVVVHNGNSSAAQTTVSVGGNNLQFEIPGRGWATLNYGG